MLADFFYQLSIRVIFVGWLAEYCLFVWLVVIVYLGYLETYYVGLSDLRTSISPHQPPQHWGSRCATMLILFIILTDGYLGVP